VPQALHRRYTPRQVAVPAWQMDVVELRRSKAPEYKNGKLKKLLAKTTLDASTLNGML